MKNLSTILFVFFFASSSALAKDYSPEVVTAFELETQNVMEEHGISRDFAYEYTRSKWEMINAKSESLETFWHNSAYMQIACGYVSPAYSAISLKKIRKIITTKEKIPEDLIAKLNKLGRAMNACIGAVSAYTASHTAIYMQKHDEECAGEKMAQNFKKCEKISYEMLDAVEKQTKIAAQMNKKLLQPAALLNALK